MVRACSRTMHSLAGTCYSSNSPDMWSCLASGSCVRSSLLRMARLLDILSWRTCILALLNPLFLFGNCAKTSCQHHAVMHSDFLLAASCIICKLATAEHSSGELAVPLSVSAEVTLRLILQLNCSRNFLTQI